MQYIRKYLQRNLIFDDISNLNQDYKPEWKPEVFIVKSMDFYTAGHHLKFDEEDIDVVIENSNYFTVVNKDLKNVCCIRFEDVTYFTFELAIPPPPIQTETPQQPQEQTHQDFQIG